MDSDLTRLMVFFEAPFWVGVFERFEGGTLSVCKVTFGAEPKDYDVFSYVLKNYARLRFSPAVAAAVRQDAANPKRMQREIRRTSSGGVYYNSGGRSNNSSNVYRGNGNTYNNNSYNERENSYRSNSTYRNNSGSSFNSGSRGGSRSGSYNSGGGSRGGSGGGTSSGGSRGFRGR